MPLSSSSTTSQDLAAYSKNADKSVVVAARGLINVVRETYPALLKSRDRGKDHDISARPARYGDVRVSDGVDGAELLTLHEQGLLPLEEEEGAYDTGTGEAEEARNKKWHEEVKGSEHKDGVEPEELEDEGPALDEKSDEEGEEVEEMEGVEHERESDEEVSVDEGQVDGAQDAFDDRGTRHDGCEEEEEDEEEAPQLIPFPEEDPGVDAKMSPDGELGQRTRGRILQLAKKGVRFADTASTTASSDQDGSALGTGGHAHPHQVRQQSGAALDCIRITLCNTCAFGLHWCL